MAVKITAKYLGNKKTESTHESGTKLITAAPKDNNGDGSSFSPTDLLATALGTCMITTLGIYAERHQIELTGMHMDVEKHMSTESPRRVAHLPVNIYLPQSIALDLRPKLEAVAHSCPVQKSLHPDTKVEAHFIYNV